MSEPRRCYVVCATQRSGSTLLCELLKDTGVAGVPEEYFEAQRDTGAPPHPGVYLQGAPRTGAGIRDDDTPAWAPAYSSLAGITDYDEHLRRTFAAGTTPNGVFGAKLMLNQLPELQALAGTLERYAGLSQAGLVRRLFSHPVHVWVVRGDKVRQAVSLWKALQTRRWREDGSPDGGEPEYRFAGVDHLVRRFEASDAGWRAYFRRAGVDPLVVRYEDDLARDPDAAVRAVLDRLGVTAPAGWRAAAPTERQADARSDEWVARYRREALA